MNSCSYGIILALSCNGFNSVILSARVHIRGCFVGYAVHKLIGGFMYLICSRNLRDRLRLIWPMYALL